MKHDEQLDLLLRRRHLETESANLADRIIMRARHMPQIATGWSWKGFVTEFLSPKPAMAFASVLVIGFFLGSQMPVDSSNVAAEEDSNYADFYNFEGVDNEQS